MSGGMIALVSVTAYLTAGWLIALRNLPRAWEAARRSWSADANARFSVKTQTLGMALCWPVYLTCVAVSRRLDAVVDAADPVTLRRKIQQRDARISELERELGLTSSQTRKPSS